MQKLFRQLASGKSNPLIIIAPDIYPGLCNSLFAYATLYAYYLESDRKTFIIYVSKRALNFETISKKKSETSDYLRSIVSIGLKILHKISTQLPFLSQTLIFTPEGSDSLFSTLQVCNRPVMFVRGWGFHDINYLKKYREAILGNLKVGKLISELNRNRENSTAKTLGVHVRRKDYKDFCQGRYFYDEKIYRAWIKHCLRLINTPNIRIKFYTSDPDFVNFHLLDLGDLGPGRAIEDLVGLSQCDYILGPPSTFSMWASFMGNGCKCMHMYNPTPTSSDNFINWESLASFNACATN
jgi:hypothetical protein